jgi:arylformamidase
MHKITEILDLTYDLEEGMTTFIAPWHPIVSIQQLGRLEFEGRETRRITFGTHTGTHVDSPLHFVENGMGIDKIPIDMLIGDVTIVDYSYLKENNPITKEMLRNISITGRMLFKFGWGKYWNSKKYYKDYPYFTKEAAEYLCSMNIKLIAMDTPSPDDSRIDISVDEDSPVHKIFLKNEVVLVEYLANTEKIENYTGWNIIVMPLKIKGADGSPARVCIFK